MGEFQRHTAIGAARAGTVENLFATTHLAQLHGPPKLAHAIDVLTVPVRSAIDPRTRQHEYRAWPIRYPRMRAASSGRTVAAPYSVSKTKTLRCFWRITCKRSVIPLIGSGALITEPGTAPSGLSASVRDAKAKAAAVEVEIRLVVAQEGDGRIVGGSFF